MVTTMPTDTRNERVRVVADYRSQYQNPISGTAGTLVTVEREDTDYRGWWWCTAPNARSGWVPSPVLDRTEIGMEARFTRDYSARELTITRGELLRVQEKCSGWLLVENEEHQVGWVPASCVAALSSPS